MQAVWCEAKQTFTCIPTPVNLQLLPVMKKQTQFIHRDVIQANSTARHSLEP